MHDDYSEHYTPPHFVKENDDFCCPSNIGIDLPTKPVAYVSGTKVKVKAKFESLCQETYWMSGKVTDGTKTLFYFPAIEIHPGNQGNYEYSRNGSFVPASTK